jgi:hypothetical protein
MKPLARLIALGSLGAAVYAMLVRPWHRRWGASEEETARPLPGDELIPVPAWAATHAITIDAPPEAVWPWLVQLGQGRGGFYTYDFLENMIGLDMHSADRILPEHQALQVGDSIPLAPGGFGIPVAALDPARTLLLHGDTRQGGAETAFMALRPGDFMAVTWLFRLEAGPGGTTRLIERFRADYNRSPLNMIFYYALLEPGSFIMERGMLLGLKRRVEHARTSRLSVAP